MKNQPPSSNRISRHLTLLPLVILTGVTILLPIVYFGVEFAFFLIPFGLLAGGVYWIYLSQLSQKANEVAEASRIHLATVEALASAIDARDGVGIGHVRRTQIFAVGLGELLELPEPEIEALRTGALLHDIGKLAIPDHILNKPEGLTPAELEKTKIHSVVGASILEKVGFRYPVVPTVRYHHERWDGKGYPEGLAGEEIPLTARILSVADAFDTLRGARPYRSAKTRDEARNIVKNEAGSRFDPSIVDLLMRNLAILEEEIDASGLSYTAVESAGSESRDPHFAEQIKLANREVFSLYELAREFGSASSLDETLQLFATKIEEFVHFDTCALYLMDEAKTHAVAAHVSGLNSGIMASQRLRVGQGATGYALKMRESIQNVDPDLDFFYTLSELAQQYTALASVPLISDGELLGAVTIYSQKYTEYGEEDLRLLDTISRIASDAVGKSLEHDEARTHALTDPMTQLPNARSLQVQFEKEVARAKRAGTSFQMLVLDLDGFKAVNDTHGHKAGDEMLRGIGQAIKDQLRDYDFLARYGGDEFIALVPDTDPSDVLELCQRIENAVSDFKLSVENGKTVGVGVSLGSSSYPINGESFDQLVIAGDRAMYSKKASRKRLQATTNVGPSLTTPPKELTDSPLPAEGKGELIVELDERHVLRSSAIN